ncbi:palmitoyltransferase ZDHHC1 isoform X5 [Syngnathus scovelli]|uniref:palmitoyltransferase ZDHHC1 isoform X5 n=1 Tax=Syngnathus scovelli TaxID=161590 RepID=UPI002110124B|nr:palmitoyltransferase ZDHHC1 isoform X5 [Syngnathus scovelli]
MDACAKTPNRTTPAAAGGVDDGRGGGPPACSRTNGWSWPPHPFQMLAWLLYAYFAVVGLGVLVPLLPAHWTPAGYICTGVMFACHLCTHVMAASVDPADRNVRAKSLKGPLLVLDRSKRAHVIENCHCYLCQVDVGPKSKHCSACNKCVADFDHHCRWLNNCVGSRNYKLFLCSVVSAVLGVCVLLAVSSYVLIRFFWEPDDPGVDKHSRAPNRTTTSPFPSPPLSAVPALAAVTGALALLACVLLCHLLLFHFYLMWNRLSTYEYIVRQRHRQDRRQTTIPDDVKHAARASGRSEGMDDSETPGYTRPQLDERRERLVGDAWAAASPLPNAPPTISTQHHTAECPPYAQKAFSQKTMTTKKKRKMGGHGAVVADAGPDARCSSERAGAWLPGPPVARPPRLHQHLPPSPPVRATAPPAEYHSDSAESLEEVPMVLDKLGSRAPWRTSVFVSGASEGRMPSAPSSSSSWFPPIAGRRR